MNKPVLLVMKWLADASSVSQEELEENRRDAAAARAAACDAYAIRANAVAYGYATCWAAYAACDAYAARAAAARAAARVAACATGNTAAHWVNEYFEITGEDRAQYEKELEK
jgi:hypothetical protein